MAQSAYIAALVTRLPCGVQRLTHWMSEPMTRRVRDPNEPWLSALLRTMNRWMDRASTTVQILGVLIAVGFIVFVAVR